MKNKNENINKINRKRKSSLINNNNNNYDITSKIDGFVLKRVKPSIITLDE